MRSALVAEDKARCRRFSLAIRKFPDLLQVGFYISRYVYIVNIYGG